MYVYLLKAEALISCLRRRQEKCLRRFRVYSSTTVRSRRGFSRPRNISHNRNHVQLLHSSDLPRHAPLLMAALPVWSPAWPFLFTRHVQDSMQPQESSKWLWNIDTRHPTCSLLPLRSGYVHQRDFSHPYDTVNCRITATTAEFRSCVKVEVAVLGNPSLISLMVSVDVKQH